MKTQLLATAGLVMGAVLTVGATVHAQPVSQGRYLTCRGEGQTILVIPSGSQTILQVVSNQQAIKISTDLKYSPTIKAYVGHVTEDTALKSKGFTPKGPITLDFASKRFVVQDPYTGSASVFVSGIECSSDFTAAL